MFGAMFSAFIVVALLCTVFHTAMRIRLMRVDRARDRVEWLSFRSSTQVMDAYQSLFPRSVLPRFCRFAFWGLIFSAALLLCVIILKSA